MFRRSKPLKRIWKKRLAAAVKWLSKEVFSGLAVAAAVAVATSWVTIYQHTAAEKEQLEKLHLGLSQTYITSVFGVPMVQFQDKTSGTDICFYKQKRSVAWCAFAENEVVAYAVIVKSKARLYRVNPNIIRHKSAYLSRFTYADFSPECEHSKANMPANNDDFAFYCERYYGAGPADYNFFILGSYKNMFDKNYYDLLLLQGAENPALESGELRSKAVPNAFGMIKGGYEDKFSIIPMSENLRVYGDALFGDWYHG